MSSPATIAQLAFYQLQRRHWSGSQFCLREASRDEIVAKRCPSLLCTKGANANLSACSSVINPVGKLFENSCIKRIVALRSSDLFCVGMGQNTSSVCNLHPRQSRSEVIRVRTTRSSALRVSLKKERSWMMNVTEKSLSSPRWATPEFPKLRVPSLRRASQQKPWATSGDNQANAVELGLTRGRCERKSALASHIFWSSNRNQIAWTWLQGNRWGAIRNLPGPTLLISKHG